MKTNTADRIDRLTLSFNASEKVRAVLEDTIIQSSLDGLEASMVEDLINAETSEKRDTAAAEIRALRKVRAVLHTLAFSGRRAEQKLSQLNKEERNA